MTAHVFIVDERTFPLHLRYQFAGTGAKDNSCIDFNGAPGTTLHHSTENLLVGMIADVSRIRAGDRVIFYLQSKGGMEGRFYGIFRATGEAFIDNGDQNQFLLHELGKSLTFRVLLEPDEVYPKGVTEWHALDEIKHLKAPYQMLWSLIYRKLKGNRGCTMITLYEEEMLCRLIREHSGNQPLDHESQAHDFDAPSWEIVVGEDPAASSPYTGGKEEISLLPRIKEKHAKGQSFEVHLQAQIVKHLGGADDALTKILLGDAELEWLGNEVSCGVGMQRIDLMLAYRANGAHHVMPIELKAVQASIGNMNQMQRYVDWIRQYYLPTQSGVISPVLLTKGASPADLIDAVNRFNAANVRAACDPLRRVEFTVADDRIDYTDQSRVPSAGTAPIR